MRLDQLAEPVAVGLSPKEAVRFRQTAGVVVRLAVQRHGWNPTRIRRSLKGLFEWFKRTERYITWKDA